jgi:hypothetical protein
MNATVMTLAAAVLGSGGVSALILGLMNRRTQAGAMAAQTGLTISQKREVDERAGSLHDQRFREQEKFWRELLKDTEDRCNDKIHRLSAEVEILEAYVDDVVPWTWEMVAAAREHKMPHRAPPSLAETRLRLRGAEPDDRQQP